jgi:hypothetical protein
MVLKSVRMKLKTDEVPVTFYRDREGRLSHHKRSGWFSPFQAAWINLRAMFVYGADFFVLKPGLFLLGCGLFLTLPMSFGRIALGPVTFSLYWSLLGLTLSVLGLQSFFFGCVAQILADYNGEARRRWLNLFRYTRTAIISAAMFTLGVGSASTLIIKYAQHGLRLQAGDDITYHLAITGLLLMIAGFSLFVFTLVLHATSVEYGVGPTVS